MLDALRLSVGTLTIVPSGALFRRSIAAPLPDHDHRSLGRAPVPSVSAVCG
jgi:hypothetical protein